MEHTHLPGLAEKHKLVNYFRFVDDILIIYDSQHTNINAILSDFNSIHPKMLYTDETEQNNTINYLDITIHKKLTNVMIKNLHVYTYIMSADHREIINLNNPSSLITSKRCVT